MSRALRSLYWLTPIAFCVALYWLGLRIWFAQDDFAWLGLRNHVVDFRSFLWAMFSPLAEGTVRPWSERGFFMLFSYVFGLRALPYRAFVFLNQFVNIVLLMLVARKLTGSAVAAFLTPLLWLANVALIIPMAWTSAYNEIQCTSFLLLSFYLFIRYTETGERKFYWAQCATFLLGFGSLEINVVYPAIAALYALLFARRYLLSTLPLFVVSAVFAVVDRLSASSDNTSFYYEMDFHPGAVLRTLSQYINIMLGVPAYGRMHNWRRGLILAAVALLVVSIIGFVAWQTWKRRFLPLFALGWFLGILAPLLPLHNHITEYYVAIPAIGIAMLAAYACSLAWQRGWRSTIGAAALVLLYAVPSMSVVHAGMISYFDRADRGRALTQSVAYAKHIHPGKMIFLKDVDDELFWECVYDKPFQVFDWHDVYLTPDSRALVHEDPHLNPIDGFYLPESAVLHALDHQSALVYDVEGRNLRNITRSYANWANSQPAPPLARDVDVGVSVFEQQVGSGWYGMEGGYRWSGKHAVVYLAGPANPNQRLYVHGFVADSELKLGPMHLMLTVDGHSLPVKMIVGPKTEFRFDYDLPRELIGLPRTEVALTVDRTFHSGADPRDLGVVFGQFTIR